MPEHRVYAVASGKGGVGKTTTAVNLGAAAAAAGRSVVVVDADLGMANLTDFLAVDRPDATLHDVLAGDADAAAAAASTDAGFDVVAGDPAVEEFSDADPANLGDAVAALRDRYEVVVLDTGAGLSHDTVVPLGLADEVVLVATPQAAAVRDARKTADLTDRFGGSVAGAVVVDVGRVGDRTPEAVADALDADLLAAVPETPAAPESAAAGVPLVEYVPDGAAARAYREAAARLLGEPVPDADRDGGPDAAEGGANAEADAAESSERDDDAEPEVSGLESGDADPVPADDREGGEDEPADDQPGDDADATGDGAEPVVDVSSVGDADGAEADDDVESDDDAGDDDAEADAGGAVESPDEGVVIQDAETAEGGADGDEVDDLLADALADADDPGEVAIARDDADLDAVPTDLPGVEDDAAEGDDADQSEGGSPSLLSRLTGGLLGSNGND